MTEIGANRYGKAAIRLVKVDKRSDRHEVRDLTVDIALEGDFAASYTDGDNSLVIATDTMKNTVYAFAPEHLTGPIEAFGLVLVRALPRFAAGRARVRRDPRAWLGATRGRRRPGARRVPAQRRRDADGVVATGRAGRRRRLRRRPTSSS